MVPRLGVLLMLLGGCSLIAMRGVDPKWDRTQEPECSQSYAPVYVDGFLSSVAAGAALEVVKQDVPESETVVVGMVVSSLLFTLSAIHGASAYNECRKAKADMYVRQAIEQRPVNIDVEPTASQGYFCTYSPSAPELYLCVRERAACEQARTSLAIPDAEACVPRRLAWCFDIHGTSRCFGTQYACEERRTASVAGDGGCTERP